MHFNISSYKRAFNKIAYKSQNNLVFNDLIKMTEEAIEKNYCLIHYGI